MLITMPTYSFEIYFNGPADDLDSPEGVRLLDAALSAGLNDGSIAQIDADLVALVDRAAPTFVDAVMSAVVQLDSLDRCSVERVWPPDLVSAAEIARRYGKTRQWIHQLVNGSRGRGDFPPPFAWGGSAARWRWSDVERYFAHGAAPEELEASAEAAFLETLNAALEFRRRLREMSSAADTRRVVDDVLHEALGLTA